MVVPSFKKICPLVGNFYGMGQTWMDGWMDGWMGWTDGRMDGWMDGWTD